MDIYPPGAEFPYRLEFFGDEVVSLRTYNTETQAPSRRLIRRSSLHCAKRSSIPSACFAGPISAEAKWRESPYFSRIEQLLLQARQGEAFSAVEFYLPLLRPLEASFFDYLSDALFLLDEPEALRAEAKTWEERLYRRFHEVGGEEAPCWRRPISSGARTA